MLALTWVVVLAAVGGIVALPVDQHWENFKKTYGKAYSDSDTEAYHYAIFQSTLKEINEHNAKFENGEVTYSMKLIEHSDLPFEQHPYRSKRPVRNFVEDDITELLKEKAPDSIDWREKGYVTPVKDQSCGDCYIYGSVGAIEALNKRKNGKLVVFSEQNIRDCLPGTDKKKCHAGHEATVFTYVAKNQKGLIDPEKNYPFNKTIAKCKFDKPDAVNTTLSGFKYFSGEDKLKTIVGTIGPVTVGYYVDLAFELYRGGVFYNPHCTKSNIPNHSLLIVGYGTDEKLGDYWIAKNSWGTEMQDKGYAKLARNRDENCGIGTEIFLPV